MKRKSMRCWCCDPHDEAATKSGGLREGETRMLRMLERTESLSEEQMMKLHGVFRGLRPVHDEGTR